MVVDDGNSVSEPSLDRRTTLRAAGAGALALSGIAGIAGTAAAFDGDDGDITGAEDYPRRRRGATSISTGGTATS